MGRLGFNLVREKDAAKNQEVESGPPADAQQNERNEGAEIGELIEACERHRRTIRSLRLLSFCLSMMLICIGAYMILMQTKQYYNDQSKEDAGQEVITQVNEEVLALQGNYEDTVAQEKQMELANCTRKVMRLEVTCSDLERKLETTHRERQKYVRESTEQITSLESRLAALTHQHELLVAQEKNQSSTLEQLRQERAELIHKLETSQRKLQRSASRAAAARSASTSTTTTTTTTPAPQRPNIFDTEQFRKINDLVKDIETGAALFDVKDFMRKTDEIFNP